MINNDFTSISNIIRSFQKVKTKIVQTKNGLAEHVIVAGLNHLDYMNLFKKFITRVLIKI